MEKHLQYRDFGKFPVYREFVDSGTFFTLKETVEEFFNCSIEIYPHPSSQVEKKHSINILENPRRGFYPIDDDNVLIIGRVLDRRILISAFGFLLTAKNISKNIKLLNVFEGALTGTLTYEFFNRFQNGLLAFGDELIKHTITNYIAKGYYNFRNVRHLMEYFLKLRTTSFEGEYFSTGVLLSKAIHDYINNNQRFVDVFELENWIRLRNTNKIAKRVWYLADGKKTFFLSSKNLDILHFIALDNDYINKNYLDTHTLAATLKGGDTLFKIENEKLFSINTSSGFEFLFFENQWKYRNYNYLKEILRETISSDDELIDSIIFYIFNCSKKQISSIIWFPSQIDLIDDLIQIKTKNIFTKKSLNIKNKNFINHIMRCFSSDGATIIDSHGDIKFLGVIADISKIKINGLKGTGESAAAVLGSNGVSIKISQDGSIKIFNKDYNLIF